MERKPRVVRFIRADVQQAGDRCRAEVELEREPAGRYIGTSEGGADGGGAPADLRCVAEAAARALCQAVGAPDNIVTVHGVETVDTFGQEAVVVSLAANEAKGARPLMGFCLTGRDKLRAAALAVLNGTNRFFDVG